LCDMGRACHAWVHLHRLSHMLSRIRWHGRVAVRKTWVATHTRRRLVCRHHLAVVILSRSNFTRQIVDSTAEPRLDLGRRRRVGSAIQAERLVVVIMERRR
jgi:hypothetical protein